MKVLPGANNYLFENIFTQLPTPTVLMDNNFRIMQVNHAFLDHFNLEMENIRYHDFLKLIRPGEFEEDQIREYLRTSLSEKHNSQFEAYMPTGPETGIWAIIESRYLEYAGQEFILSVIKDITGHKKEEETIKSHDERIQEFMDNANDLIQSISPEGDLLYVNRKWEEMLGYRPEEIGRLHITDILREDQIPQYYRVLDRVRAGEKCELFETVFTARDGRDVFVEGNVDGIFEFGKLIKTRDIFRDISKRKALEETYSQLVKTLPVSMFIIFNRHFRLVNPSFEALSGYTERELIGKEALLLVHPEDAPFVHMTFSRVIKNHKSANYEYRIIRKSGEVRWVMETVTAVTYEGHPALLGTMVDLTERKMVEGALQEAKNRYQTLFNSASDAILIHDTKGHILEVNDAACNLLKYTRADLLKLNLTDIKSPRVVSTLNHKMEVLTQNGFLKTESEDLTSEGRVVPVEVNSVVIEYENKPAVLNVARDISERRQAEAVRKQNQARLESQIKITEFKGGNSQDLLYFALDEILKLTGSQLGFIYYYDRSQRCFTLDSWSKEVQRLHDKTNQLNHFSLDKTGLLGNVARLQKAVMHNTPQTPDLYENGFPQGPYQLLNYLAVPLVIARETVAVIGVANKTEHYESQDIHQIELFMTSIWNTLERWKAEEALRASEHRYRLLIECSQDGILEMDENGLVQMVNAAAARMMGYSIDEMIGMDFAETCLPEEKHLAFQRLERLKTHPEMRFERTAVRKNGSQFSIDVSTSPLARGCFQEVIRDITARKKMEQELQENEQKYRLLVDNQSDLVMELNTSGEFLFVNPSFCKLTGKSREELVGTLSTNMIHPDDIPEVTRINRMVKQPPYYSYSEHRIITCRGWRWVAWTSNGVVDNEGNVIAYTCMGRDITESKEAKEELEQANQRLRELDKLKDNFLSTVSHELRTPLTSIKSFVEILLNYDEDKSTQKEFLGIINEESDRLTRLINDFLDISKIQAGRIQWKTEELNLPDIINSVSFSARPLAENNRLTLKIEVAPDLPRIIFDKDRLIQVFTNLLGNAIKFTPEGGTVSLWVKSPEESSGFITVSIADTGIGIAPENHNRIFENFGQVGDVLKDRPKGTGLGLPISKKIIENYSGKIWVESDLGQGTTFHFTIPVAPGKSPPILKNDNPLPPVRRDEGKTVLVVDDEANIRLFIKHELTVKGHRVIEASGGKEAVELARKHHPDLITLDIMMPDLDGFDVTAVLKSDPSTAAIPILIITVVEDKQKAFRLGANDYLTKPISLDLLLQKVNHLLSGKQKKIICVDDEPSILKSIEYELGKCGYSIECCQSGRKALQLIREEIPDLVILDINMPDINGIDVMQVLKTNPLTVNIPIVIITGIDIDEVRVKALAMGANYIVNKSEGFSRLHEAVARMTGAAALPAAKSSPAGATDQV